MRRLLAGFIFLTIGLVVVLGWQPISAATRQFANLVRIYAGFNTSLVGYWSFDGVDISGTTATDRGSGGTNGTLTGGPKTAPGVLGQALLFDGSDDLVSIADAASTDFGTGSFTLEAWVKRNGFISTGGIISKEDTANNYRYLLSDGSTDGNVLVFIRSGADSNATNVAFNLSDGNWHHLVMVVDRSNNIMQLYGDGAQQGANVDISAITGVIDPDQTIQIGRRHGGTQEAFNGFIDEPKIYSRALTASEVFSQYKRGAPTQQSKQRSISNLTGLKGYWSFDDCDTCTTLKDMSGNGNNLTMYSNVDSATVGDLHTAAGKIGNAGNFDGSKNCATLAGASAGGLNVGSDDFTIEAWINSALLSGNKIIMGKRVYPPGYVLYTSGTSLVLQVNDASANGYTVGTYSFTNSWHHIVIAVDRANDQAHYYLDGQLTQTTALNAATGSLDNAGFFGIACDADTTATWEGMLDEVKLYGRLLSADEVMRSYQGTRRNFTNTNQNSRFGGGLVGFWSFNGPDVSGTTATDRSGSGFDGTLTNSPELMPGLVGQGLKFDGSNDEVTISGGPSLTTNATMMGWFYWDTSDSDIASLIRDDTASGGWILAFDSGGLNFRVGGTNFGTGVDLTSYKNKWTHYAAVKSGADVSYYLDGVSIYSSTGAASTATTLPWHIMRNGTASTYMKGVADEIRMYDRALSSAEIAEIYRASKRE